MSVKVNDIYYSSWGYDQTNIDFYQVIKVTASNFIDIQNEHCYDDTKWEV